MICRRTVGGNSSHRGTIPLCSHGDTDSGEGTHPWWWWWWWWRGLQLPMGVQPRSGSVVYRRGQKNSGDTISCFNMSSLRRGHADRLCNIPSFTCDTLLRGCAIMDIWWAYVKPVGLVYFGRTVRRHTQVLAAGRRHPGLPWCTNGMYPPDTPIMRVP